MAFPNDMPARDQRTLTFLTLLILVGAAIITAVLGLVVIDRGGGAEAQTVREYNLEIVNADIDYGGGNVWHAWTYKLAGSAAGTVPGPTLTAVVGEKLKINVISGISPGAMIPPGGSYSYEFELTEPGLYYYHDHSADGGGSISANIHQGLYGAIIVKAPDEPTVRDEVIFMGEIGSETEGDGVPVYIMNGLGIPGGEHHLEAVFREQGFDAVAAQLGKTVPVISAKVGEVMRVHVVNIGDQIHSFHAHSVSHISIGTLEGGRWAANLLPLLPGAADTLQFTFTNPGLWLFHCHVVNHADAGMIGIFNIEEPTP